MKSIIIILSFICVLCAVLVMRYVRYKNQTDKIKTELMHDVTTWGCRCHEFAKERDAIRDEYNALLEKHNAILSEAQQLRLYRTSHNYTEVCEREHTFVTKLINAK